MNRKTSLIIMAGAFSLLGVICLLIAYWLLGEPRQADLAPSQTKFTTETTSITRENVVNTAYKQELPPLSDPALTVSPILELEALIESFEKVVVEEAQQEADLAAKILEWRVLKKNGKKLWVSERWMKEPRYYESLDTLGLAEECFSQQIFAAESGIFDDPRYAFERLKVFHNGFAELFEHQDMWKGILHVYEYLRLKLDLKSDLRGIVDTSDSLLSLSRLYGFPTFKEQVKGRERTFLAANVRVLRKYKYYLENYDPKKRDTPGFFGEPCVVAQVALMLTKQVDPQRYAEIECAVTSVRWPQEQRVEDLKSFVALVIVSLDGVVPDE